MEVSGMIDYEQLHDLKLTHPITEKDLGITFKVRSAGSTESKNTLRRHIDANLALRQKGKTAKASQLEKQEVEKIAACIAGWDWGDNTWHGQRPEFSMEKAVEILLAEGWIYAQVSEAANSLENFTSSAPRS